MLDKIIRLLGSDLTALLDLAGGEETMRSLPW
jgi:hypothetical protein